MGSRVWLCWSTSRQCTCHLIQSAPTFQPCTPYPPNPPHTPSRLQDVLSGLITKYADTDKKFQHENNILTEQYRRITEQYKALMHPPLPEPSLLSCCAPAWAFFLRPPAPSIGGPCGGALLLPPTEFNGHTLVVLHYAQPRWTRSGSNWSIRMQLHGQRLSVAVGWRGAS